MKRTFLRAPLNLNSHLPTIALSLSLSRAHLCSTQLGIKGGDERVENEPVCASVRLL